MATGRMIIANKQILKGKEEKMSIKSRLSKIDDEAKGILMRKKKKQLFAEFERTRDVKDLFIAINYQNKTLEFDLSQWDEIPIEERIVRNELS